MDIFSRDNWIQYADILTRMYSDPDSAETLLQSVLGPQAVISRVDNSDSPYPGTLIAVHPDYTVVFVSGTTNEGQWALQALTVPGFPVDNGAFSTDGLWYAAAMVIHGRITAAGGDITKPILFVGHSYGGAASSVLVGRYINGGRPGPSSLLTFGMPKPGDIRLANLLAAVPQVHFVDRGDPVPFLPPDLADLAFVLGTVPGLFVASWTTYVKPHGQLLIDDLGEVSGAPTGLLSIANLAKSIAYGVFSDPFALPAAHQMAYYLALFRGT